MSADDIGSLIVSLRNSPTKFEKVRELLRTPGGRQQLGDAVRACQGITHMARQIGLTSHAHLSKLLREGNVDYSTSGGYDVPSDAEAVNFNVAYWQRRAHSLQKENAELQELYANIGEVISDSLRSYGSLPRVEPYHQPITSGLADEELAFIFVSDTHVGELVKREHTAGMSEYNMDIFVTRCERYKEAIDGLINEHLRKVYPIKKAIVVFLGDAVTGEQVFPKQAFRIDRQIMEQAVEGACHLSDLLLYICSMFEDVYAYMVPGNHGADKNTTLNMDYILYLFMAMLLHKQENLHSIISDGDLCGIFIDESLGLLDWPDKAAGKTWNFLFTHGSNVKGWAGIPYYGLDRMVQRLSSSTGIVWDHTFAGHFHSAANTASWTLVGSWVGGTEYSLATCQSVSRPTQLLQGFHPHQGLTWRFPVYLGEEPHVSKDRATVPGVYTPANSLLSKLVDKLSSDS